MSSYAGTDEATRGETGAATQDGTRPVVLYIGGFGRSGSTLLELLLGRASDVTSIGEVVHLWERGVLLDQLCGCGQPFSSCPFWTSVGARAFGGWPAADAAHVLTQKRSVDRQRNTPLIISPRMPRRLAAEVSDYATNYRRVYEAAAAVGGTGVVVDSSKHPSLAAVLSTDAGIDLRVVHLVRDSRGVAYSWSKDVRRPEDVHGESYMPRYSAAVSSGYWLGQNGLFHLMAARGVPVLRLRYEDLVGDPTGNVAAVRRFAGLPGPAPRAGDPEADATLDPGPVAPQHSVAGNPLRFGAAPLTISRDERWREVMAQGDRRLVSVLTAPLALRYRYLGPGAR